MGKNDLLEILGNPLLGGGYSGKETNLSNPEPPPSWRTSNLSKETALNGPSPLKTTGKKLKKG